MAVRKVVAGAVLLAGCARQVSAGPPVTAEESAAIVEADREQARREEMRELNRSLKRAHTRPCLGPELNAATLPDCWR